MITRMPAKSPEEICRLFRQYIAMGDIDSVLDIIYDHDVVFLNQACEEKKGREALRQELAPFAAANAIFDFNIKQVIQAGDIALMHTEWKVSSPPPYHHRQQMSMYAIEVARRQSDGTWRWLIGDPFTVGRTKKAGS
ncbi:MAG: nuclear transport factor 2 family protein [Thermoproteota archaeon]